MHSNRHYGPGPANYNISGLAAKGKDTPPQMSLQSRSKPAKIIEGPAPGMCNKFIIYNFIFYFLFYQENIILKNLRNTSLHQLQSSHLELKNSLVKIWKLQVIY